MSIQLNNAIWHGSWNCNTPGWGWKECDLAAGQDASDAKGNFQIV